MHADGRAAPALMLAQQLPTVPHESKSFLTIITGLVSKFTYAAPGTCATLVPVLCRFASGSAAFS
jgi:hypothetical protein